MYTHRSQRLGYIEDADEAVKKGQKLRFDGIDLLHGLSIQDHIIGKGTHQKDRPTNR